MTATNREVPLRWAFQGPFDLFRLCRRRGIPVLVPSGGDPNEAPFLEKRLAPLDADAALSFYCHHRLGRRLRALFEQSVNYHDGLLPDYRGVMATSFSIFAGEKQTGFCFHHMSGEIDAGPVLVREAIPLATDARLGEVVERKSARAAAALPGLLRRMADHDPGRPQAGDGQTFTAHDLVAMTRLTNPENATRDEILRRIRAFGEVCLAIEGHELPVTRLRASRPGRRLTFRTADGQWLAPDRLAGLPVPLFNIEWRLSR